MNVPDGTGDAPEVATNRDAASFWPEISPDDKPLDNRSLAIAERRAKAARLYVDRKPMRQIADALGCSLGTTHNDLKVVLDGWKRMASKAMAEHVAEALAKLAALEASIQEQWDKSCRQADGADEDETEWDRSQKKPSGGDPRYVALLQGCWDRRCKILGLLKSDDFKGKGTPPTKLVAGFDPTEVV